MKILVLNGPNLNMLGIREPEIYGKGTYKDLVEYIGEYAEKIGVEVVCLQTNSEGRMIDCIQEAYFNGTDGICINPGGYTHTSVALLDALKAVRLPVAEVHISDISERDEFRKFSYVSLYAQKTIYGKGFGGYAEALDFLLAYKSSNRL